MDVFKLSKFKLQLETLITEVRELREKEHSSAGQLNLVIQNHKEIEEEFGRKLQELQADLASSNETRQKLKRKVSYFQNDNALLENKQKELKVTIDHLLQTRENFVNAYEDSTREMKSSIEIRDRKLSALSVKINSHFLLFNAIEKEASSVKQLVENVQSLVSEKEKVVAGLKSKMDNVSALEKVFVEKISDLESKLQKTGNELQRKNKIISELEAQREATKFSSNSQPQIEELQRALSVKEVIIENMISEKKVLHFEVSSLGIILQKIKDAVSVMSKEDKQVFSSILESQEELATGRTEEIYRVEDIVQPSRENSPHKASGGGAMENTDSRCDDHNSVCNRLHENNNYGSCVSDSACVEPQSAANVSSIIVDETKDNCMATVYQLDSESSTTQAEASEHPG